MDAKLLGQCKLENALILPITAPLASVEGQFHNDLGMHTTAFWKREEEERAVTEKKSGAD